VCVCVLLGLLIHRNPFLSPRDDAIYAHTHAYIYLCITLYVYTTLTLTHALIQVVESGTHEELLALDDGIYKDLWKVQAGI
jgi:hypothetical protein